MALFYNIVQKDEPGELLSFVNSAAPSWILGVVLEQLQLLHSRVGGSTTSVIYLSPQMSELVEDAIAS